MDVVVEMRSGTITHHRRSGTGVARATLVADPWLCWLLVLVPSAECLLRSAFCAASDYERGTTIAVVAGSGAATVAGSEATAVGDCAAVGPLGVMLGVVAAVGD